MTAANSRKPTNEGQRRLIASGLSLTMIAEIGGGGSKSAAQKWRNGAKPGAEARARFEADPRTQIPRAAWDTAPGQLPAAPAAPPPPAAAPAVPAYTPEAAAASAAALAEIVDRQASAPTPRVKRTPAAPAAPDDTPPEAPLDLDAPGAARELVKRQLARLRADVARHRREGADVTTIARAEESVRKAALDLAKLAGELNPTEEARLVKSATWGAIKSAIFRALEPHPDAFRAALDAVAELDA